MVQSAIVLADRGPVAPAAPAVVTEICGDLLKLFGSVPDGRSGQGRDHPVAAVLALAAAAVVAGMKGYTAIAGWVRDVPPPVLADLYLRAGAGPARPPSKATIWRVVTDADADAFDATVGSWLMSSLLGEPAAQVRRGMIRRKGFRPCWMARQCRAPHFMILKRPCAQYLGPTNSSSRATASRRATDMAFRREKRHATPS